MPRIIIVVGDSCREPNYFVYTKTTKVRYFFTFLALAIYTIGVSQEVYGYIKNKFEPLIGATVQNLNTGQGTITDNNGYFSLPGEIGQQLKINYLGYKDVVLTIETLSELQIMLQGQASVLDEIVVTALGVERERRDLGYSIQSLSNEEINGVKSVNFLDNLTGKIAGLTITQGPTGVGSTSKITIRGESSFTNNNPLFVIDGTPINNNTLFNVTNEAAAGFQEVDFGNGAMDVNADDIASVSVLKGPGAAALYGARAANGVILITTKNGSSKSGLGVSFNSSIYAETPFRLPEFQKTYGVGNSGKFAFKDGLGGGVNDNITYSYGPKLDAGILVPQFDSPVTLPDGRVVRGGDVAIHGGLPITPSPFVSYPNNIKDFYGTGKTFINNLAFSGGNEQASYRISLTNMDSESFIPGSNLKRNTINTKLKFSPVKKLDIHSSISYTNTASDNRPSNGYGSENINYAMIAWLGRETDINNLKSYWQPGLENLQQFSYNYTFFDNPYFTLLENRNAFKRDRLFGNISATYRITDHLTASLRSGIDNSAELRTFKRNYSSNRFKKGAYAEHDLSFFEMNTDFLVTYDQSFENWNFEISGGGNRMNQSGGNTQTQAIGLAQPGVFKLSNAGTPLEVFQNDFTKRINSLYALAKFGYKNFFYLDLTGRNDWSSALANPQSAASTSFFYPSASASLMVSELLELPENISFAKLRLSLAQVGNDTDPYQTAGVFLPQVPFAGEPTFSDQNSIANANLLPEKSTSFEAGLEFGFFNDKLQVDLTWFNATNENQILSLPITSSTGYQSRVVNGGAVRSSGFEAQFTANPIRTKNFTWTSMLNFSHYKNEVISLPDEAGAITLAYSRVYDNPNQTVWFIVSEGSNIGDIWGTGYLKNNDGRFIITSQGLPTVDNTLKKLGNYNPDFIVGFNNEFSYKNLSLSMLLDWRQGGDIVSRTQALAGVAGQLKETENRPDAGLVFDGVLNTGTKEAPVYIENTIAVGAETYYRQLYDRNHEENSLYDATYVKIRQMSISYDFNTEKMPGILSSLGGLKLSLIGRNLYSFDKIPHFDPEQFAVQGNKIVGGVEDMSFPTSRSIGLSLGINF